ncbi:zincin [Anaeromyces robustus]|uniref:Zincin n=1 Tax=Anaeromyces robustus TaxID=1754192 RepID=A0A1Y1WZ19_9FUNG|nr:zincin [Anaeromyces robustus]|eukprot:ORX78827.1 zincin [Anaeromyces robustus]
MKQYIIFFLSLITLSELVSSGIIRERGTCYNEDGSEIPCVKVVEKAEDFMDSALLKSKRSLFGNDDDDFFNNFFGNNNGNSRSRSKSTNIFSGEFWENLFGNKEEEEDWWNPANNVNPPTVQGNGGNIFGGVPPTVPVNGNDLGGAPPTINNPPVNPPTVDTSTTKQPPTTNNGGNNGGGISLGDLLAPIPEPTTKTIPPQALTTKAPPSKTSQPSKNLPTNISTKAPPTPQTVNNNNNNGTPTKTLPTNISTKAPPNPQSVNNNNNDSTPSSNGNSSKIPIKNFSMTGFEGCNEQQKKILEGLIEDIKTYRAGAVYLLNNVNEDPSYQKIFDKYYKDPNAVAKVKKVFENVNGMESAAAYCEPENETSCAEGAMAWTYLHSREFHVCPVFFREAMFGTIPQHTSEASSIVLHEMTHCYGTDDYAYGEQNVSRLPAEQATNNADTYRLFAMSAIYYLKDMKKAYNANNVINNQNIDEFLEQIIDFRPISFTDKVIKRKDKMVIV